MSAYGGEIVIASNFSPPNPEFLHFEYYDVTSTIWG